LRSVVDVGLERPRLNLLLVALRAIVDLAADCSGRARIETYNRCSDKGAGPDAALATLAQAVRKGFWCGPGAPWRWVPGLCSTSKDSLRCFG